MGALPCTACALQGSTSFIILRGVSKWEYSCSKALSCAQRFVG